ncbi:hypothetical protein SAMN02745119_00111 [Trichlorobacter thiogenes]|uniref:Uncharacterized protein n=1 Tax=Trichlorobacter thiogenes TaxID=115783 RepID=A0A1T4JW55_9BACT|nr:hypothetical protein [Trichlorobacter thiogenes]SJZ34295.1 hypothetical protein SAMN02745119_00111 [Trichlorobacter thiogenes]
MRIDPPKDEGLDLLLQEIAKNLEENQRFIKGLKEDRMDRELEDDETGPDDEEFEEL